MLTPSDEVLGRGGTSVDDRGGGGVIRCRET